MANAGHGPAAVRRTPLCQCDRETGADYAEVLCAIAIAVAAAGRRLFGHGDRWLNPPEWVEWIGEPELGYPKRPVTGDETEANELKKRALTNLYNVGSRWLVDTYAALNGAVASEYRWNSDAFFDDVSSAKSGIESGSPWVSEPVTCQVMGERRQSHIGSGIRNGKGIPAGRIKNHRLEI